VCGGARPDLPAEWDAELRAFIGTCWAGDAMQRYSIVEVGRCWRVIA
jgi:hypothetical protein